MSKKIAEIGCHVKLKKKKKTKLDTKFKRTMLFAA